MGYSPRDHKESATTVTEHFHLFTTFQPHESSFSFYREGIASGSQPSPQSQLAEERKTGFEPMPLLSQSLSCPQNRAASHSAAGESPHSGAKLRVPQPGILPPGFPEGCRLITNPADEGDIPVSVAAAGIPLAQPGSRDSHLQRWTRSLRRLEAGSG